MIFCIEFIVTKVGRIVTKTSIYKQNHKYKNNATQST